MRKYLTAFVAVVCCMFVSQTFGLGGYTGQGSTIISQGYARIPLCFPNGFPYPDAPANQCYNPGFLGSWDYRNGPCLPPIVNGKLVPPCNGRFYALTSYY